MLFDDLEDHGLGHYFYQAVWATGRVLGQQPSRHVDVGSQALFVGMLSRSVRVISVEIRPLGARLPGLQDVRGAIESLPFESKSLESLSCLHVLEHVGLGRYGDRLDPRGHVAAAAEIERVMAPRGRVYLSVPVGRPHVEFNSQRILDPVEVRAMFPRLDLVNFSVLTTESDFRDSVPLTGWTGERYALGMFELVAP